MKATSKYLQDWLREAGLGEEYARRVIIDIQVGEFVRVYIERFGSTEMFSVSPPDLRGAEIHVSDSDAKNV